VDIRGDLIIVGAQYDDTAAGYNAGSAYIFQNIAGTWTEVAHLTASDGAASDYFGVSVAIEGDTAVAGAYGHDTAAGTNSGAAYVFHRSGGVWTQQAELTPLGAQANDWFGYSVDLDGGRVLVGAYLDDTPAGANAGSAYVFDWTGAAWAQTAQLTASDASAHDAFGINVALSGNNAIIGAYQDSTATWWNTGSAYIFNYSGGTWSQTAHLVASDGMPYDQFGDRVAIYGDDAIVGALYNDRVGDNAGAAYIFHNGASGWVQTSHPMADDAQANDQFGYAVAMGDGVALVGAMLDDTSAGTDAGSVYAFQTTTTPMPDLLVPSVSYTAATYQAATMLPVSAAISNQGNQAIDAGGPVTLEVHLSTDRMWGDYDDIVVTATTDTLGLAIDSPRSVNLDGTIPLSAPPGKYYVAVGIDPSLAITEGDETNNQWWSATADMTVENSHLRFIETAKLLAPDAADSDRYGFSVAAGDDWLAVGAPYDGTPAGTGAGSVYLYERSGDNWVFSGHLYASDPGAMDYFGYSLAMYGDDLVVGANTDTTAAGASAGSAYVFHRTGDTWDEQAHFYAPDGASPDYFGCSVAISGDDILVGAYFHAQGAAPHAGAAYFYNRLGGVWSLAKEVAAADPGQNDRFGRAVAIDGDWAIIGALCDTTVAGSNAGSVYVFQRSGSDWSQTQRIVASNGVGNDRFGNAVALDGDTGVVGAPYRTVGGTATAGAAYILERNGMTWSESAMLTGTDGSQFFGASVALQSSAAIVGSYRENTPASTSAGAAYVFVGQGDSWTCAARLFDVDGNKEASYGQAVAAAPGHFFVGAPTDDDAANDCGSVFVYDYRPPQIDVGILGTPNVHAADLGGVVLGQSSSIVFTLSNNGGSDLHVTQASGLSAPVSILPVNGGGSGDDWTLAAQTSMEFTVTFTPKAVGPASATLALTSDDLVTPTYAISISGLGLRTVDFDSKGKAAYFDHNHVRVAMALTGGGSGTLFFGSPDADADAYRLEISPSSKGTSALTITTSATKPLVSETTLGTLVVHSGSMKSITARTTHLVGEGIRCDDGTVGSIKVGDLRAGAGMILPGTALTAGVTIQAGAISGTSEIASGSGVKSLSVLRWVGGGLAAPWLGSLAAAGDFGADLTLSGVGVAAKAKTLGAATVKGAVTHGTWDVAGATGAITIRGAVGGAGATWVLTSATTVASLTLGDVADAVVTVSGNAGAVKAIRWQDGSLTGAAVTSITTTGVAATKTVTGISGDFGADVTLSYTGTKSALASLTVAGWLTGATISSAGAVGTVSLGGIRDSTLSAGDLAGAYSKITGVTVKGIKTAPTASFVNSKISAWTLGTVSVKGVQTVNGQAGFGIQGHTITSYTRDGKKYASKGLPGLVIDHADDYTAELV